MFNLDCCTPGKEVLTTEKWNALEAMYEEQLLIRLIIIFYHAL